MHLVRCSKLKYKCRVFLLQKKKHLTQNNSFAPGATSGPRTNHISTASCLPISVIHEKRFCLSSVKQKIN